jgi:hypothetical protein
MGAGHLRHRSVHRYKRGKEILREAVDNLEKQKPAKILSLGAKGNLQVAVSS